MKPSFALNLSPDGVGLLHRTNRGWFVVGEVSLEDADFTSALGYLRSSALGLEPGGLSTKLILPDSQILYTRIPAPGPSQAQRRAQIEAALEGMTPYPVNELVYDWVGAGPDVQIAIIARESLNEAETFATKHRFNPVSFVARPEEDDTFNAEPFFGQTAAATTFLAPGAEVERDAEPVCIVGRAILPRKQGESAAPPSAQTAPQDKATTAAEALTAESPVADTPSAKPHLDEVSSPSPKVKAKVKVKAATTPDASPKPKAATRRDVAPAPKASPESPDTTALPPSPPQETKPVPDVAPTLKTTTAPDVAPTPGAKATSPNATPNGAAAASGLPASDVAAADGADTKHKTPTTFSSRRQPPLNKTAPSQAASVAAKALSGPAKSVLKAPSPRPTTTKAPGRKVRKAHTAPAVAPALDAHDAKPKTAGPTVPSAPADADAGVPKPLAASASTGDIASAAPPVAGAPVPAAAPRHSPTGTSRARIAARSPAPAAPAGPTPPSPRDEAEAMTIFGERGSGSQRGKPRYPGLILALILLVSIGLAALWLSRGFGRNDATSQPVQSAALSPAQSQRPSIVAPPPLLVLAPRTSADTVAKPATPSTAPTSTVSAAAPPPEMPAPETTAPAAPTAPASGTITAPTPPPEATETAAVAPQTVQPPADGGTPALPADPTTRLVPADIIVQKAPKTPASPVATPRGKIYLAGIDAPRPTQSTPGGLPAQTGSAADASPSARINPPPYGTIFDLNARGLVKATPDGTETPQGVTVYAALPPAVPPPRPGSARPVDAAPDATQTAQTTATLAARPATQSSAPQTPANNPALAGLRPRLRPAAGLYAPPDTTPVDTAQPGDGADSANTSPLAVARSPVPHNRPAGIAGSVSAAVATQPPPNNTARQDAKPETTSHAPRLPTNASVAKEATMRHAITLNRISLIGVFGTASNRRALLRTSSGRIVKVSVGDRLDGGKVAAIGPHELHYVKSGRSIVLSMPR